MTVPDRERVSDLLRLASLEGAFEAEPLPGGGNNRVYRLRHARGEFLLKHYFWHPMDPRDRGGTESAFLRLAWGNGIRSVPRPLAYDPDSRLGLGEFVAGRKPAPGSVTGGDVDKALDLVASLDRLRGLPEARALAAASEACFSLHAHLERVQQRVHALANRFAAAGAPEEAEAARFVAAELIPRWNGVRAEALERCAALGWDPAEELPREGRCLSPSDFGFHNALREESGALRFLDFEYAGWDDPAKLICDFFCQPAVPVPASFYPGFRDALAALPGWGAGLAARSDLLLPVYRVKWSCVLLNEYLPAGSARRGFAGREADPTRKRAQLVLAREALSASASAPGGDPGRRGT